MKMWGVATKRGYIFPWTVTRLKADAVAFFLDSMEPYNPNPKWADYKDTHRVARLEVKIVEVKK